MFGGDQNVAQFINRAKMDLWTMHLAKYIR